jgi:HAD superfamily hydrolase (TIGR01490 family)
VQPETTRVAVFDLDRTLIERSSLAILGRDLVRRGLLARHVVARRCLLELSYTRRGLSSSKTTRLVGALLGEAAGRPAAPLREAAQDLGPALAAQVVPVMRAVLDRHLDAGDHCIVLSASPHELVESVTAALGAHRGVGTRVEVQDDCLTGRLAGPFCYAEGKVTALRHALGTADLAIATAYADSMSDLPLLERCGVAVAVNLIDPRRGLTLDYGEPPSGRTSTSSSFIGIP